MEYGEQSVPQSFEVTVRVPTDLSKDQAERLRTIAGKCPVHRLLSREREVSITDRVAVGQ
jgi:uncharacterized OsmC-like protein